MQEIQINGIEQALGRSREGLTTKIHAACVDEVSSVGLVLSPSHGADCTQFEELYSRPDKNNVLESIAMDKGYDSNAIRYRISESGIIPVSLIWLRFETPA